MSISFRPMRQYMKEHNVSYYFLGNEGIDGQTLHRIRHNRPISTKTLAKLCHILKCQPSDLIEYVEDEGPEG